MYGLGLFYRVSKTETLELDDDIEAATSILNRYGRSSMDYFKLYPDKQLYFNESKDAFLAFSESKYYGVVLENPVAADLASATQLLIAFEDYCSERGLRTFYYRVMEEDLPMYLSLKKKSILLNK